MSDLPRHGSLGSLGHEEGALDAVGLKTKMKSAREKQSIHALTAEDLVPDEPLQGLGKANISAEQDLLHHRVVARRIAELAVSASGKVNIALFGPWGSGKSSFNALLKEELSDVDDTVGHVTFDAWKNSGDGFRANFLSELARQISPKNDHIAEQLFQGTTKVSFPFGATYISTKARRRATGIILPLALALLFLGFPFLFTLVISGFDPSDNFVGDLWRNVQGWVGFGVSSTLIVVVLAGLLELSKVTVSRSMPSHVAQFTRLFDQLLAAGKKRRYVVFVDELDRCSPEDVVKTLEGLRTFLGDERCVFVVAFDRSAVAETISTHLRHAVPQGPISPYYGTSGEYLDKIFQFQLSLPPQAAHTFRRYALSLVAAKGGVWSDIRSYKGNLLERVVTVLAPMHLASPRRTKVLLNDFAVSARVYESLGFQWLQFAEEIAILSVLRTEFPALMADIERNPALMRFLFRGEMPARVELASLVAKYAEGSAPGPHEAELDTVVEGPGSDEVARKLLGNLHSYLRRLRELRAPEPRAELIMMHSGGALVHFKDPSVYDAVLLAPDSSRRDVVNDLEGASEADRVQAVQHILEQSERESAQIAEHLRILAGELSAALTVVPISLANALRAATTSGLDGYSHESLHGYARAIAADFTLPAAAELLDAAEASHGSAGGIVTLFLETLTESDWERARDLLTARAIELLPEESAVLAAVVRRLGTDVGAVLRQTDYERLVEKMSVQKPVEVKPEGSTTAARQVADEKNDLAATLYESVIALTREASSQLLAAWDQLPAASMLRRDIARILRGMKGDVDWHLDEHDSLVVRLQDEGDFVTANQYLLDAIIDYPHLCASRWRGKLSNEAAVEAQAKSQALEALVGRATSVTAKNVRENAATNALRVAQLPSTPISAAVLFEKIGGDIRADWEEYSDNRFEYQWDLLAALDAIGDREFGTVELRTQLVVDAVRAAQLEDVSTKEILAGVATATKQQRIAITSSIRDSDLWVGENGLPSLEILISMQNGVIADGGAVAPVPGSAIAEVADVGQRQALAQTWLATAPSALEVEAVLPIVTLNISSWKTYAQRASEKDRVHLWWALVNSAAPTGQLSALASAGMPVEVYERAATEVGQALTTKSRRGTLDVFLALPPCKLGAPVAQRLLRALSGDGKVTELPLGMLIIQKYAEYWSSRVRADLRPVLAPWVEAGGQYTSKANVRWLSEQGFVPKKSSRLDKLLGRSS